MKQLFIFCLLAVGLMAAKCGSSSDLPESAYGRTWLHSYEEDSADVRTYRPNSFDFPPSRGRTGFIVKKEGDFIRLAIAPTDGLEEQPGTWQATGKKQLQVKFNSPKHGTEELELISVSPEVLKVRRKVADPQ
ncbi:hypothetical protein [Rufibacter sp. LB8]|uniref:hypothetical protein n=1 Tax=Rufibacter sp. LB8 TaxID=2777781 RepID=UPI001CEFAC63|nr:hypothetical protein [Rufibacter sp. LB8]